MNVLRLCYFSLMIPISLTAVGCGPKGPTEAELKASADAEHANASSQKYQEYSTLISQVPMVGIKVEEMEIEGKTYNFVTSSDMAMNQSYISQLELKIKSDTSLNGTETTGDKGDLLRELKSPKNLDFLGTVKQVNYPLIQATYNKLAVNGPEAMGIPTVTMVVMKVGGQEGYIKLSSDRRNFATNLRDMFYPFGVKFDGGNIS